MTPSMNKLIILSVLALSSCTYELGKFAVKEAEHLAEEAIEEFATEFEHEREHGKHCECGARIGQDAH
ncbi:hypothetical protein Cva_00854 [Caedimonas varicaedens]|uniref:Lipoprotein n=1 Tax=Caedimonas varicaedens TaxID=1629334 RepID=A0A0K8MCG1_9PROT|nr:hypothetical protein Cva_00854 [Caedimonas varicaedens]